jgi:hypothetical protein
MESDRIRQKKRKGILRGRERGRKKERERGRARRLTDRRTALVRERD